MFWVPWLSATTLISVADRSEVRLRPELTGDATTVAVDAETRPEVALAVQTRRTRIDARYGVSFTAYDLAEPTGAIYQSLDGQASYRLRRAMIYLRESSGFGQRNLRLAGLSAPSAAATAEPAEPADPGAPTAPPTTTPVPNRTANDTLNYASMAIGAGSTMLLTRHLSLNLQLDYSVSGGLDDESTTGTTGTTSTDSNAATRSYPLQRMQSSQGRLDLQLSRQDTLAWRVNASRFETSPEITAFVTTAEQLYARRLARNATLSLSAGAAYVEYRANSDIPAKREAQPVASADLDITRRRGRLGTSFGINLSLAPIVDRRTGLVDERANFTMRGGIVDGRWSFGVQAAGTRSLDQDTVSSLTVLQGSGAIGYAWSRYARAEFGSALTLQSVGSRAAALPLPGNPDPVPPATSDDTSLRPIWGVFAAITFQSAPKRL